jgi:hypothetical protein
MCTMHLLGAIPNAGKYLEFSIEGDDYYPWQSDDTRFPGWGVEINPAWLEKASYKASVWER